MIDLTDAIRERIPPRVKRSMLKYAQRGFKNLMNSRIVSCHSVSELANNYNAINPCYAYIHGVRYRNPAVAYMEHTENPLISSKRNEFILQDRSGQGWCWAADDTTLFSFRRLIPEVFSDHDMLDLVFGPVGVDATDDVLSIVVKAYKGRSKKPQEDREIESWPWLAYCKV